MAAGGLLRFARKSFQWVAGVMVWTWLWMGLWIRGGWVWSEDRGGPERWGGAGVHEWGGALHSVGGFFRERDGAAIRSYRVEAAGVGVGHHDEDARGS